MDGLTPVFTFGLGVQNTTNQSFTINSIAADGFANNFWIGNVSSFTAQTIQPNSNVVLNFNVRLQLIGVVNDLIRAFVNKNFTQYIIIKGTANVDSLQVPIVLQYRIGL